jgi:hypothetical protein
MGVSGQRHSPAALYLRGKNPLANWQCGPQSQCGHTRLEKESFLPPPGIEPRSPGRPVRSLTLRWLSYQLSMYEKCEWLAGNVDVNAGFVLFSLLKLLVVWKIQNYSLDSNWIHAYGKFSEVSSRT